MGSRLIIALLALAGLVNMAIFVRSACGGQDSQCSLVSRDRAARLLWGLPNTGLGAAYYLSVGLLNLLIASHYPALSVTIGRTISLIALAISLFLALYLILKLKIPCPICMVGHGINLLIALVYWLK